MLSSIEGVLTDGGRRTNEQIVHITEQGYLDIVAAFYGGRNSFTKSKKPGALSVIVTGHSVYISSTLSDMPLFL